MCVGFYVDLFGSFVVGLSGEGWKMPTSCSEVCASHSLERRAVVGEVSIVDRLEIRKGEYSRWKDLV